VAGDQDLFVQFGGAFSAVTGGIQNHDPRLRMNFRHAAFARRVSCAYASEVRFALKRFLNSVKGPIPIRRSMIECKSVTRFKVSVRTCL
jgi:hypothetical protein